MKKDCAHLDGFRNTTGDFASPLGVNYGMFRIVTRACVLRIISSGDCIDNPTSEGWEHVSVSTAGRCPTWEEMAMIKDLFWNDDETVIQFHPKKSEYVNNHHFCLHLWKNTKEETKLPPSIMVGLK